MATKRRNAMTRSRLERGGTGDAGRERTMREQLVRLLAGGGAHAPAREILGRFPARLRGVRPRGSAHSAWQLLEHLRIAQEDLVRFALDPAHESPEWPAGFWPPTSAPPDARAWSRSTRAFLAGLAELESIARDPRRDLLAPIPHARPATLFGQLLLAAGHNSYHLGQLVFLERTLARR
jgi:hypothetical protein